LGRLTERGTVTGRKPEGKLTTKDPLTFWGELGDGIGVFRIGGDKFSTREKKRAERKAVKRNYKTSLGKKKRSLGGKITNVGESGNSFQKGNPIQKRKCPPIKGKTIENSSKRGVFLICGGDLHRKKGWPKNLTNYTCI